MTNQWPSVTAQIVTCKGRAGKLKRALDSVLAQTYRDFDCQVIHDGPADDETQAVYEEYARKFDEAGIAFYPTWTEDETGYYTLPRNMGIMYAKGDYMAPLDDDNEWTPQHLEVLMTAIEEGEQWPDVVYGRRRYLLEEGAPVEFGGRTLEEGDSPFVPWEGDLPHQLLQTSSTNFIDSGDMLVARGAFYNLAVQTGKMWNEDLRRFGDYELVARGAFYGGWRFKGVDEVVQNYYIHGQNVSLVRPYQETPYTKVVNE